MLRSSRMMLSKNSSVSRRKDWRRLSSKLGNVALSGSVVCRLRRNSHCAAKLVTSASERGSASIRRTCRSSAAGILELALRGDRQELIVGNAAPQEKRQARRQLEIADRIGRPGRHGRRVRFAAEQEVRAREDQPQRVLDSALERALLAAGFVEADQRLDLRVRDRPPVGAARERRQDLLRASAFVRLDLLRASARLAP